jgi:hypothetical protein
VGKRAIMASKNSCSMVDRYPSADTDRCILRESSAMLPVGHFELKMVLGLERATSGFWRLCWLKRPSTCMDLLTTLPPPQKLHQNGARNIRLSSTNRRGKG